MPDTETPALHPSQIALLHNDLVEVEALCALEWDGDPETDGSERYEPRDNVNGLPSFFMCPLITAQALARAGIVKLTEAKD